DLLCLTNVGQRRNNQRLSRQAKGEAEQHKEQLQPPEWRVQGDECQLPGGKCQQQQAGNHHRLYADAVHQASTDDHAHHGGQCLWQQDQASLESALTSQNLEVDGDQKERAEKAEDHEDQGNIASGEGAVGEETQVKQ